MKLYQSDASSQFAPGTNLSRGERDLDADCARRSCCKGAVLRRLCCDQSASASFPTLVLEDGTAIGEVPAILRYLEEIHPDPPLLGATPKTERRW